MSDRTISTLLPIVAEVLDIRLDGMRRIADALKGDGWLPEGDSEPMPEHIGALVIAAMFPDSDPVKTLARYADLPLNAATVSRRINERDVISTLAERDSEIYRDTLEQAPTLFRAVSQAIGQYAVTDMAACSPGQIVLGGRTGATATVWQHGIGPQPYAFAAHYGCDERAAQFGLCESSTAVEHSSVICPITIFEAVREFFGKGKEPIWVAPAIQDFDTIGTA